MRALLVLACGLMGCLSLAQSGYRISGTVVAGASNKPLKHVLVTIVGVNGATRSVSHVTGDDGRFVFTNLPAGKFALSAQKQGALPESFHENEGYSTAIVTGPGNNSENIVFPLTNPASISGIVNDDQGDPVRDAEVLLFHRGVSGGKLETQPQGTAQTDSSGMFHFGQLKPGTYLIAAEARPWYAQNGALPPSEEGRTSELDVAYPVTYYGGSTDPSSASSITLIEGGSSKIEITLRAVPAAHVQMTGANAIQMFVIGPGGYKIHANGMFIGSESDQQFTGIAPGRYIAQTGSGVVTTVDLGGRSTLELGDIPESSISGHVTFEGDERPNGETAIVLSGDSGTLRARIAEDGSFKTANTAPGRYSVQLPGAQAYYVKSVVVGDRAAPDQEINVTEGSAVQVSIVAAKGVSQIDGIAIKDGAPFAGAMVLLLPQDLSRSNLIRRDQSDSDGTFTLPGVAPGRYTLVAIDDGRDLAYRDPGMVNAYLRGGQVVDVPLVRDARVKVEVQHRQR